MGCDITAHVEIKIHGTWHHWNQPNIMRSYALFARMANVRNDDNEVEPISEPRGLPENTSFTTNFHHDYDGTDAHSESWLNGEEVASLGEFMRSLPYTENNFYIESQVGYIFGNGWDIKKYPDDYPSELEDVRLVFWFDN